MRLLIYLLRMAFLYKLWPTSTNYKVCLYAIGGRVNLSLLTSKLVNLALDLIVLLCINTKRISHLIQVVVAFRAYKLKASDSAARPR